VTEQNLNMTLYCSWNVEENSNILIDCQIKNLEIISQKRNYCNQRFWHPPPPLCMASKSDISFASSFFCHCKYKDFFYSILSKWQTYSLNSQPPTNSPSCSSRYNLHSSTALVNAPFCKINQTKLFIFHYRNHPHTHTQKCHRLNNYYYSSFHRTHIQSPQKIQIL